MNHQLNGRDVSCLSSSQRSRTDQWIAYESDESGPYEIYVQPFTPATATSTNKVLASTEGGAQARWRHDGKALFYVGLDGRIVEGPLRFSPGSRSVEPGTPVPLLVSHIPGGALQPFPRHQYDVARDGRFLMVDGNSVAAPLTLVLTGPARRTERPRAYFFGTPYVDPLFETSISREWPRGMLSETHRSPAKCLLRSTIWPTCPA